MFKQSPRRNQRNKGFKVKHALQICLLLAVSIWLLYQVQHSHNKKATNVPKELQNGKATIKLGRKDLQPQVEGSVNEYVRHKEDQEEESKPDEQEPDEESETEAQKEETNESKDIDLQEEVMEDREKETKEEPEDGNKESIEESTDSEKEEEREESKEEESGGKAIKEEEEINENGSEKIQEKSSIENGSIENSDNKENGSEETQEKSSKGNDTTENGDGKQNGREETQEKSTEENDSVENGEIKENKEVEGESKGSEEKEIRDEKLVENEATGSEKRNTDEKTRETREEREGTIENSGAAEIHKGENVSNEVGQETKNIPETEGGITETSNAGDHIKTNEGNEFEEKGIKNTEATSENENNSGSNVAGNAIIVKNDTAILIDSEGNKNGTSLLEMDSYSKTTGTTEYAAGKTTSDPTSGTSQNKNKTVDNVIPFGDSTQTVLEEQTEKPEEMTSGENSDLNSAPPATENKGTVNGNSMESFNNIEAVVLEGQSANTSTSIEAQNNSENSTGKEDNDAVQNQKSDTDCETSVTEEHRELSNENMDEDSRQNNAGDSSTSEPVTEKEASSSPNDNADASKQSEVNSYSSSKEAHTDLATLPESGTEGKSHDHAAEK